MILILVAAALLLAACAAAIHIASRLLPLFWPDRAYRTEMARRDKAAAEYLNHEQD